MPTLNLHAPIIAGKSAADFSLGMDLAALSGIMSGARVVDYFHGFSLVQALKHNSGALCVRGFGETAGKGTSLYFGPDTVRLTFNEQHKLGCIYLFPGYLGHYGNAGIGSPLSLIAESEPLAYDDGDEMYYRVDAGGCYKAGLAVIAPEATPTEYAHTRVYGFCTHDWSLLASD